LNQTEGVQLSVSIVNVSKAVTKAFNEGSYKWLALSRNQKIIDTSLQYVPSGFINKDCSLAPIFVFLNDHKAETLQNVVDTVENYRTTFSSDDVEILLAAGNAGIEVATNQLIKASQTLMMLLVYAVVAVMVLLAYRSMRAVVCIVLPLVMTSVLCTALMAYLGIGVKVSTLPIIALGVGLGVDYGIYIYSRLEEFLEDGLTLQQAYFHTLRSTGKAVAFTGLTLAIGTATWIFSPIKFQSDMGILLTFMFLWNMFGALTLLPMLSYYFVKDGEEDDLEIYKG
jgi:predicted RND superfamily exporter protein